MNRTTRAGGVLLACGLLAAILVGCTGARPSHAAATTHPVSAPSTATKASPTPAKTTPRTVPTDVVGKSIRAAKTELAKDGFVHLVIAGGDGVTDAATVRAVSHGGQRVAPATKIVLTGAGSARQTTRESPTGSDTSGSDTGDSTKNHEPAGSGGSAVDTAPGCGQRAVAEGHYDSACQEYQGYLDPGTAAGRGPTSGELQQQWGCQQGYISKDEC